MKRDNKNFNKKPGHFWHLVNSNPWPFLTAFSLFNTFLGFILHLLLVEEGAKIFTIGIVLVTICLIHWVWDLLLEGNCEGRLTEQVKTLLYIGISLFLISEGMFFFGFFWSNFHFTLAPDHHIGSNWPPQGIQILKHLAIPLLNTMVLLLSGVFATWTHRELLIKDKMDTSRKIIMKGRSLSLTTSISSQKRKIDSFCSLLITIILALIFTLCQLKEYILSGFQICDSAFGSIFFLATGFHGFHVILGTIFLCVSLYRLYLFGFTEESHLNLEFSIWYWHFVDVVWLFLYISIYWYCALSFTF